MQVELMTADGFSQPYRTQGHGTAGLSVVANGAGDWGSGDIAVQIMTPLGWQTIAGTELSDDGTIFVEWPEAATWRVEVDNATTPTITLVFGG